MASTAATTTNFVNLVDEEIVDGIDCHRILAGARGTRVERSKSQLCGPHSGHRTRSAGIQRGNGQETFLVRIGLTLDETDMNPDLLISLLVEINCLFLAGWVLVLAATFVLNFPEKLWFAQPPKSKVFAEFRRRE